MMLRLALCCVMVVCWQAADAKESTVAYNMDSVIYVNGEKLSDIPDDGNFQGAATDYLNCDDSSGYEGSIGDFETLRRCRALEVTLQTCLIPCVVPVAIQCKSLQIKDVTAEFVYGKCLSLDEEDTDPAKGLFAKNSAAQEDYGGACSQVGWEGDACKTVLGADCAAPDSKCSWYCVENQQEREAFCRQRMIEITATRTLAIKALKDLLSEKKRSTSLDSSHARKALADSLYKRALKDDENEDLILLAQLLEDNTIEWDN